MKTDILQQYICNGIDKFNQNSNTEKIVLGATDLLLLSSNIANNIPSNPDMIIDNVLQNVLSFYEKEDYEILLKQNIKFLLKQYLVNNITSEQQLLLIFYVILDYKINTKKSFTLEFKNVQDYFESYIISNTEELVEQIEKDKIQAVTRSNDIYFIRFTSDNKMVPTFKTNELFTKYLYDIN